MNAGGSETHLSWTAETDFYQNFWLDLGVDFFFFLLDTAQTIYLVAVLKGCNKNCSDSLHFIEFHVTQG